MTANSPVNLFTLPPGRVHVMGICGVGAAGVAWMLHLCGWKVSGCDHHIPPTMEKFFARNGIRVFQNHDPGHLAECDALVYSAAIHADEPELALARAGGMTVLSRGECLAGWVSELRSVAVCGTHGKTTASCFTTRLLQCIGQKPLWCLGGYTPRLLTNAGPRHGDLAGKLPPNQIAVAESDESDGTLAYEHPAVALITNIDIDHLDHFQNAEAIEQCFATLVGNTREAVAVCADAPRAMRVAAQFRSGPILTYGFSVDAMLRAVDISRKAEGTRFTLMLNGSKIGDLILPVPGDHNLLNALGAMAACLLLGFDAPTLAEALPQACAELPKRRFQWLTPQDAPVRVVMDYAHHPTEIQAMLSIAGLQNPKRIRLVFQPHRHSRTLRLMNEFVEALRGIDEVILLPVYAAGEDPAKGAESWALYEAIKADNPQQHILLARTPDEVTDYLAGTCTEGDLILIVGAGDVERIAHALGELPLPKSNLKTTCAPLFSLLGDCVEFSPNEPLADHTFYRASRGRADILARPKDVPALSALCTVCKAHQIPFTVIGGGSNSWFSDLGLPGVLCELKGPAFEGWTRTDDTVTVGAGMTGAALLAQLEREGLSGLEFMQGVPGTVGGWIRMNAGAHNDAVWNHVLEIRAVLTDGQIRHIPAKAITAGYRSVRGLAETTILEVTFTLTPCAPETIHANRAAFAAKRVKLEGLKTCGSLFKNADGFLMGRALDALGAKSWRIGGAFVTAQHANIIAADAGCTASDILALMQKMRDAVSKAHALTPNPEVCGF